MGVTFAARVVDIDQQNLRDILERAANHKGTSLVEIYQNCHIFNDGTFEAVSNKKQRDDNRVMLEHGKPMVFGKDRDKGIRLDGLTPEVVSLGDGKYTEADLLVHDEKPTAQSWRISCHVCNTPTFQYRWVYSGRYRRTAMGMVRDAEASVRDKRGLGDWDELIRSGDTWVVE